MGADPQPHRLHPEEQRDWDALACLLTRLPAAFDAQLQRDASMSHFDYTVLATLSAAPSGALRLSRIARRTGSALSRLSNVVIKLEKRGLVRRSPDPVDGRSTLAALTEAGRDALAAGAPAHVAEVRRLVFDPLTGTQQRQLRAISARILRALDPEQS
ncbi:MarR family winged helix-turn-helix transcriptional regulator [Nocardia sp. NBC_00416]|uniref:MarR family winged helix-turn-helix transcriptional regulator n=1 Tax=Nocardia sp. NBC_00416 TaxID=2975991 RepID=UPI002E1C2074